MYCRHCGKELKGTPNYCRYCGWQVKYLRTQAAQTYISTQENWINQKNEKRKLQRETTLYTVFSAFVIFFFVVSIIIIKNSPDFSGNSHDDHSQSSYNNYSNYLTDEEMHVSNEEASQQERILGSAKELRGKTVLVCCFVQINDDAWTEEEKQYSSDSMKEAVAWIEEQGLAYGQEVDIVYDLKENSELCYNQTIDFRVESDTEETNQYSYYLYNKFWIQENLDVDQIKERYQTDNIGYLFFVKDSGTSYTYSHYIEDNNVNKEEMCTIYLKDSSCLGCYETPATYAHEILHLYGALDLYEDACPEVINTYVGLEYPYEIMLSTYQEPLFGDGVTKMVSPITAYMLNWTDYIDELSKFPELERKEPACFSEEDYGGYYFEDEKENK
ncbi:zinc ribbon domain-containing protein [Anaerosporobacter faecicola]|uniref:hypothetical protein n=1 Tax=Anaerosporobacter faecicola TaxID=2718714 RepID=UPI001438CAEA|nr:hypothetical protein [Anaerosporobacter faecicola]